MFNAGCTIVLHTFPFGSLMTVVITTTNNDTRQAHWSSNEFSELGDDSEADPDFILVIFFLLLLHLYF